MLYKPEGDVADILALPAAVAEGKIASPFLLSSQLSKDTVIIQGVKKKGILAGPEVSVDKEAAQEHNIDIATRPRAGRGGLKPAGTISLQELLLKSGDKFSAVACNSEETACLLYTSGTTDKPKGVMLSHKNFLATCRNTDNLFKVLPTDRVVGVLPFYHVFGLTNVLLGALTHGARTVLVPQYSPANLLRAIIEAQATLLLAIPTMYVHLLKKRAPEETPSLRICISGAAPLPADIIEKFQNKFNTRLIEGYGLTESTAAVSLNPPDGISKPGSIGIATSGVEMKVLNENGSEVPVDEIGEIVLKSDSVMRGYHNLPEETNSVLKNGWLYTGDLGYKDKDGYFYITDRKKEIIIRGGFNISPREIEEVITAHPEVKEAAVLGVIEEEKEAIKAFVVVKGNVTPQDIIAHCQEQLAAFKVPKYVEFRDTLPKSVTGKVLKRELSDTYRDERLIEKD